MNYFSKRKIKYIVVCYWTDDDETIGMAEIDSIYRRMGYLGTPYHFCIKRDGVVQSGRPVDRAGYVDFEHAQDSLNVVTILPSNDPNGTAESCKYTPAQKAGGEAFINSLMKYYPEAQMVVIAPVRSNSSGGSDPKR